jgi:hypothetical protein
LWGGGPPPFRGRRVVVSVVGSIQGAKGAEPPVEPAGLGRR